jgi:formate hydrogenlyase transcriptional activator
MSGDKTSPYATGEDFCPVFETMPHTFPVGSFEPPDIPGGANSNLADFPEVQYASGRESFEEIVGKSQALWEALNLVRVVGPTDSTVLIEGETGTGKELIARAVCAHSRRKERRFVKINCASIPTGLLESELFGHEKGAFTGAVSQKVGRLELADQGTLFLDEVGDIPIEIQPKLLRALQEQEFERLGSTHTRKVNVRLVAATNRDLEKMVANREFRSDLFYRLNVFPIRIPPLRDRREDIPLLVSYFVQKFAKQMQKKIEAISPAVMNGLTSWQWPGNIRELENFIERAVILTRGKSLEAPVSELRGAVLRPTSSLKAGFVVDERVMRIVKHSIENSEAIRLKTLKDNIAENWRVEIMRVLRETHGKVAGANGAAARMGIKRSTLVSRMKKLGISRNELYPSSDSSLSPVSG